MHKSEKREALAYIKMVNEKEAQGKLAKLYEEISNNPKNRVAHILKVHSLQPEILEAHLNLYKTIMFGESGLSREEREMIAVVVSATNSCQY